MKWNLKEWTYNQLQLLQLLCILSLCIHEMWNIINNIKQLNATTSNNNKNPDDEFRIQINCNYEMSVNFSAVGNWQNCLY